MKLKIISDIHLNHYAHHCNQKMADNIFDMVWSGDYDYLIAAGDIGSFRDTERISNRKDTIVVFGNHEFYRLNYDDGVKTNFVKHIDGQKFVCTPMFSKLDPVRYRDLMWMPDFKFTSLTHFDDLYEKAKAFLEKEVTKDSIVVTHFVPSYKSMAPEYKGNTCNSFFITEWFDFIFEREPKMWIHGHTHTCFDYMIGNTRVVCNPFGYYFERTNFNPNLIIEI